MHGMHNAYIFIVFHGCQPVFKGCWPDSENSKLVKALTGPKGKSRNAGHAAGAHWHRLCMLYDTHTRTHTDTHTDTDTHTHTHTQAFKVRANNMTPTCICM